MGLCYSHERKIDRCDYCKKEMKQSELKFVDTSSVMACRECMEEAKAEYKMFCKENKNDTSY